MEYLLFIMVIVGIPGTNWMRNRHVGQLNQTAFRDPRYGNGNPV